MDDDSSVAVSSYEQETALNRRAQALRVHYGQMGRTVYDRLDRWREEHWRCAPKDHEPLVERGIYVIYCRPTNAVAVCESWQFSSRP